MFKSVGIQKLQKWQEDFESVTSANSITPAYLIFLVNQFRIEKYKTESPLPQPENWRNESNLVEKIEGKSVDVQDFLYQNWNAKVLKRRNDVDFSKSR